MTDYKFSVTSLCHKTTILHIMFKKKILSCLVSFKNQSMQANVEQAWRLQGLV